MQDNDKHNPRLATDGSRVRKEQDGERRDDKTKSHYSQTWGESLHVVTVSFV